MLRSSVSGNRSDDDVGSFLTVDHETNSMPFFSCRDDLFSLVSALHKFCYTILMIRINSRCSSARQGLMLVIFASVFQGPAFATVTLYPDLASWQSAFATPTFGLMTDNAGVALANEVINAPSDNDVVGNDLNFESANTGFGFDFRVSVTEVGVVGDGFTFNDTEGDPIWQTGVLSVGDIDNAEDDGFEVFVSSAVYGFYLDFVGNDFSVGETLSLFNGATLVESFTTAGEIPDNPGAPVRTFWGVASTEPFTRVVFDEDPDGDDIGIADFGFATSVPIPEPSGFAFAMVSMFFTSCRRRRRCLVG